MILVVDASVVIKLAVEEDGRDEIRALLSNEDDSVVAPEWMLIEVANALWRKWRMGEIERAQAEQAMEHVITSFPDLVSAAVLAQAALKIALELDHPVYDCAYLACARHVAGKLVTADRRLIAAAVRGGYAEMVLAVGAAP